MGQKHTPYSLNFESRGRITGNRGKGGEMRRRRKRGGGGEEKEGRRRRRGTTDEDDANGRKHVTMVTDVVSVKNSYALAGKRI